MKASTANAQAKLKQKQTNSLEAYPNPLSSPLIPQKFCGCKMNPKDAGEAKEKLSDDDQREAVLITRWKGSDHITVRYLESASSHDSEEGWGYQTRRTLDRFTR